MCHRRTIDLRLRPRNCKTPTAARILELLDPLARNIVNHHDTILTVIDPDLSPLQPQILNLLGVPRTAYNTDPSQRSNSS